jgi:putative ABC transport system permease protein
MLKLAWRNLLFDKVRLIVSAGGVALAVVLILVMGGVFAGSEEHAITYIKKQPATLWMMQDGVSNMHMSSSLLPPDTLDKVRSVNGVMNAVGLLYTNSGLDINGDIIYSYIFAVDKDQPFGGPWKMDQGSTQLEMNQVIIDKDLAARFDTELGGIVNILGSDLEIIGLSNETFGIATSISFVNKSWLASVMGVPPTTDSYILIQPEPGINVTSLAEQINQVVPGSNIMTQSEFAASDQEMIRQMGVDIIKAMNYVSYMVGLLVIGLTIYTATLERSREFGMLKAIGANMGALIRVVFSQAFISAGIGFITGVILAYIIGYIVSGILPDMLVLIRPSRVLEQIPVLLGITAIAGLIPLRRIRQLDPMVVFKE